MITQITGSLKKLRDPVVKSQMLYMKYPVAKQPFERKKV
jgi:hypothetical protein